MKRTTILATLTAPLILTGCSGAYWGNLIALGISAGVFFGTLSLGRVTDAAARSRTDAGKSIAPAAKSAPGERDAA